MYSPLSFPSLAAHSIAIQETPSPNSKYSAHPRMLGSRSDTLTSDDAGEPPIVPTSIHWLQRIFSLSHRLNNTASRLNSKFKVLSGAPIMPPSIGKHNMTSFQKEARLEGTSLVALNPSPEPSLPRSECVTHNIILH